jgi:plasmid stabilization system protein ParE
MPRLIWSPGSLRDLQRLYRFLASNNNEAARRAIASIKSSANILAKQPHIGRPAEGMSPEFREWLIEFGNSGYIALYHFDGETAVMLAVRHQREVIWSTPIDNQSSQNT